MLSHFQITARLGEGGMGEVWRASDERLGREVAIKVLPPAFTSDADRLARFQREARVLASLNHPRIAGLHDVGEEDGTHFLVMELAPGETLAERLAQKRLPLEEALEISRQVADALSAAHEQGIVHRDLKPGNVMVAETGTVKVLDFGLAKAWDPRGSSGSRRELSVSPTLTFQATAAGVLLGTASYMSPEQAKAKPADRRSDVWAFGCLLFEMLSGQRAFDGETVAEILASILRSEPDWEALPTEIPEAVIQVLRDCLAKDPEMRLRDVSDAQLLLERGAAGGEVATPAEMPRPRSSLPWSLAALAAIVALFGWLRPGFKVEDRQVVELSLDLDEGSELALVDQTILAMSPDESRLAFVALNPATGRRGLFVRSIDQAEPVPLAGTEGAVSPFFSPDGRWLGFFADGRLKKIPSLGGSVEALADAENPRGAVWTRDGRIVFSPRFTGGLWRLSADGGPLEEFLPVDEQAGERTFRWPDLAKDGLSLVFTVGMIDSPNDYDDARIVYWDAASGQRRVLVEGANLARLLGDEVLLFYRDNVVFGAELDSKSWELGAARPVLEGVLGDPSSGSAYLALGGAGSIAYVPGTTQAEITELEILARDGEELAIDLEPQPYHHPHYSPDGRQLAFTKAVGRSGASGDIWTYSLDDKVLSRLTFDESGIGPVWSADGQEILFNNLDSTLAAKRADGSGGARVLLPRDEANVALPGSVSPDGSTLAYVVLDRSTTIWIADVGKEPRIFEKDAASPSFSPDGRYLAYMQPASGPSQVYVRPLEGEGKWQVSQDSGNYPHWTSQSNEIFFLAGSESGRPLVVVQADLDGGVRFGVPEVVLADTSRFTTSTAPAVNWDVRNDGQQFVFVELLREESAGRKIQVTLGWGDRILAGDSLAP